MKRHFALPFIVIILGFAGFVFAADVPETLTLRDMVNRPERWPETITITRNVNVMGGVLKPGQQGRVMQWDGSDVGVDMGKAGLVGIGPEDCDLLDAANKMWAKLTPEQRAIDLKIVQQDSSIWPAKVTSNDAFSLDGGKEVPPGREYDLIAINKGTVIFWDAENKSKLQSQINNTDVVRRAREVAAIAPDKRPARVANALKGHLVDAAGKEVSPDKIDEKKIFLVYYGASWCPPCRQFSPGLVKTVNKAQPENPNLMVVMMSNDEKDDDLFKYMTEEKMPFPAMTLSTMKDTGFFLGYAGTGIPQVTILDKYGKVLATSTEMNRSQVMGKLDQILKAGAAK